MTICHHFNYRLKQFRLTITCYLFKYEKRLAINNKQSRSLELKDVTLKLTEIVRIAPEVVLHFGISAMGIRLSSKEVILERLLRIEDNSLT